ncbi:hypothetical protein FRACYDRAFT_246422 [Fragilariopsis cylindrus CCMP1102]|uniref:Uncharacterized protein n=1 Tax=Fragilariopsis cylindrus CCMP1102 TaxID=635003 RepID=A0A1E7EZ78_9STRA|nr:hypothetical protein FRACYDRAFT_246422 [Fragilariopsis cylindrus CCMP1102]|eukprot:OEU11308.1 hypothetical protein FRACYDRAFT_246422 [Fragilariopsis cylindrus CCMP1102]
MAMAMEMAMTIMLLTDATVVVVVEGFVPTVVSRISTQTSRTTSLNAENEQKKKKKKGNFFTNMFEELDAFMDDATARRLGNGAAYYGKRKSSFYGAEDKMKKSDRDISDSEEDYMINAGGNYKWVKDENGIERPVSRMKGNSLEKKESLWGRKDQNPNTNTEE